jgi:hypothetical protein
LARLAAIRRALDGIGLSRSPVGWFYRSFAAGER